MATAKTEEAAGHEHAAHDVKDEAARGYRKARRGYVTSDKMDKTIVVEVEDRVKHALYGKVLRRTSKVKVHDEQNSAGIGDLVLINETRPISATKRWRLVQILEKAK
jgi:small subunit ribosomal protein S17